MKIRPLSQSITSSSSCWKLEFLVPSFELELELDPLELDPLLLGGFDKSLIPVVAASKLCVIKPSVISDSWVVN